ncbi:CDGSH iron-sulfur domain-containing protein [Geodermatophilus sp. YIM 151500]|uniref:CDGSH iron-sulfur domain-containing protein n=1 Tax=Geodermatophilus sp. YIM 151500 TaxID=2984531 RepID=UPI0021E4E5A0|nr:CDGSH iron-sulfur domain-containing protein [Geodermatophilus sp. YIM 151500]MCV2491813.1 CDGSH iron-sulfur domain-containing protein [Geodermatophilus sp. YIM 151500]
MSRPLPDDPTDAPTDAPTDHPADAALPEAGPAGHDDGHDDPLARTGATITPYRDGPLLVRGDFRLVDQDGTEIDPGRRTVALCRCGKSGIKPFCDGTHKRAGFVAGSAPRRPRPASRLGAADRG